MIFAFSFLGPFSHEGCIACAFPDSIYELCKSATTTSTTTTTMKTTPTRSECTARIIWGDDGVPQIAL